MALNLSGSLKSNARNARNSEKEDVRRSERCVMQDLTKADSRMNHCLTLQAGTPESGAKRSQMNRYSASGIINRLQVNSR